MFKEQPSSPTAKRADLLLADGDTFSTVELRAGDGSFVAHWLVSGLDIHGLPAMILELSVPMTSQTHEDLAPEALEFGNTFVLPMATHLATTRGVGSKIQPLSVGERAAFFEYHMSYQFSQERAGSLPGHQKTECLFKMATYLGVFAPLKQIANFMTVPVTTVEAHVKRARAAGNLPKASEVRARTKALKKGE